MILSKMSGYGTCTMPFLWLSSIYKPSFISIPFVLSKIVLNSHWIKLTGVNKLWGFLSANQKTTFFIMKDVSSSTNGSIISARTNFSRTYNLICMSFRQSTSVCAPMLKHKRHLCCLYTLSAQPVATTYPGKCVISSITSRGGQS